MAGVSILHERVLSILAPGLGPDIRLVGPKGHKAFRLQQVLGPVLSQAKEMGRTQLGALGQGGGWRFSGKRGGQV